MCSLRYRLNNGVEQTLDLKSHGIHYNNCIGSALFVITLWLYQRQKCLAILHIHNLKLHSLLFFFVSSKECKYFLHTCRKNMHFSLWYKPGVRNISACILCAITCIVTARGCHGDCTMRCCTHNRRASTLHTICRALDHSRIMVEHPSQRPRGQAHRNFDYRAGSDVQRLICGEM